MSVENPFQSPFRALQQPSPAPQMPPEPDFVMSPTEDGGMMFDLAPQLQMMQMLEHDANLAEFVDEITLGQLATELIGQYEADKESRADWEKSYIEGLDLLGLKFEDRDTPWAGACGVFHPMLSESVVRFQAQTIQEIFPASGPAKTKIAGNKSLERTQQALRVEMYLNYLATEEMVEYRNETERLLFSLPIAGSAFRKVYYDQSLGRPCSMFVPAEDFVVSYGTSDLSTCERATHVMKRSSNWVRKMQVGGFYRDLDLPTPSPDPSEIRKKYDTLTGNEERFDVDQRHTLLEMQVTLDLKGFEDTTKDGGPTGVALPYVVTLEKSSREVLSIRRNWAEDDPHKAQREHFVHYQYLPGLGFYGFGLVHLIGGLSKSATSLLLQLVDSGTLSNLPGGLKTRGLRIKGDDSPIMPGEFRDVDVPMGTIKDNLAFLPYKEPSSVLYQLLADIVQEGRHFASAADLKASDINGEAPVGTTLAILEREMKVLSAVQARVHSAMGKELRLLAQIVADFGPEQYPFEVEGQHTLTQDFDARVDIIPVSDPNAGTMAQRIMQYQAALQLASTNPQMYDLPLLHRQMLEVLGIQDAAKIVPTEEDILPTDPVTENMNILNGKPVKAFLYQDHEAHIAAHMAAAQHPQMQELLQKNPKAKVIMGAAADHLTEHLAMAYRQKIEQELGVPMPGPDEPMPEDIELRLSRLVAPAAAQVTGKAQKQKQAEKNAEMMKDPIVQMQMQELQIKQQDQQRKQQESAAKHQLAASQAQDRARLERERMAQKDRETEAKNQMEQAKLIANLVIEIMDQRSEQDRRSKENRLQQQRFQQEQRKQSEQEQKDRFDRGLELADRIIERADKEEEKNDGGSE